MELRRLIDTSTTNSYMMMTLQTEQNKFYFYFLRIQIFVYQVSL